MSSRSWIPKWDRGRAQARPESPNLSSLLPQFFSDRGSRSPAARQAGGTSSSTPAPIVSNDSHVQVPDSIGLPDSMIAPSTQEPTVVTASSGGAMQNAYDVANIVLPIGLAAVEPFAPAKAAIGCIMEIVKLVEVSFRCRHDPQSLICLFPLRIGN